jgi:hypothetical protein
MMLASFEVPDPGNGGTINCSQWFTVVPMTAGAGETRILAAPTKQGIFCLLTFDTDNSGNVSVTVTNSYSLLSNTGSIAFTSAGDTALLVSVRYGTTYRWRLVSQHTTTGIAIASKAIGLYDNDPNALIFRENTTNYLGFDTSNNAEKVTVMSRTAGGVAYSLAAAGTALTNSAAETNLASYAIPANTLKAGTVLKVKYQGIATAQAAATTLAVKLKIGTTVLVTHTAHAVTANDIFRGEFTLVARAAPGAAAACVGEGLIGMAAVGGDYFDADKKLIPVSHILASTNLATNGALTLALTGQWGGADASSCRCDVFNVEIY